LVSGVWVEIDCRGDEENWWGVGVEVVVLVGAPI
jgi:hypothetical protein